MTHRGPNSVFRLLRPFKEAGIRLSANARVHIAGCLSSPAFESQAERAAWVRRTIWTVMRRPTRDPVGYVCWMAQGYHLSVLTPEEEQAYQADEGFGIQGNWRPLPVEVLSNRPPKAELEGPGGEGA